MASGIRRAKFKIQKKHSNRIMFRTNGKKMSFREPVGSNLTVTIAVGNQCTTQTANLRSKKGRQERPRPRVQAGEDEVTPPRHRPYATARLRTESGRRAFSVLRRLHRGREAQLASMDERHVVRTELIVDVGLQRGERYAARLVAEEIVGCPGRCRILAVLVGGRAEQVGLLQHHGLVLNWSVIVTSA
jgi:hypothetical protein